MISKSKSQSTDHPVIKCVSVCKVFGENANRLLKQYNGVIDAKIFQEAGCVVGVNNASFEVQKGYERFPFSSFTADRTMRV